MAAESLTGRRLHALGLGTPRFDTPADAVAWIGAMQAQDWYGSLWALGSRLRTPDLAAVEAAIEQRRIVRTWPMRGTLHFVAPDDVRWMLQLLASRVVAGNRARLARDLGLDEAALRRSRKVVERALREGEPMTRGDVYAALQASGIDSGGTRGTNITTWLAHQGVICGGPRAGKQPTFVLLDAWIPPTPHKTREEAMHALALRYFRSHGPATVRDLAWWSGLTIKDAQLAADLAAETLLPEDIDGCRHWHGEPSPGTPADKALHLLAPFDEYLVGYKDRGAALDPALTRRVIGLNGLVNAVVLVDGRVVGTWKRTLAQDAVAIDVQPFRPLTRGESALFGRATKRYAAFLGCKLLPSTQ